MSDAFKLTVPVDARYRVLAPDVAAKYAELAGCSPSHGANLGTKLAAALDELAQNATAAGSIDLEFHSDAGHVTVSARCNGRTSRISEPVSAARE